MKIVIAITGASGAIYARRVLDTLRALSPAPEVGLVFSDNARTVWQHELGDDSYSRYPFPVWEKQDFNAPFASGSAGYQSMIVVPCSMGVIGRIASGVSNDLITRAADVILKERRKLICLVRETPYSLIHLRNMTAVTEAGGIILPASPSFYSRPQSMEELAGTVTDRALQLAGLPVSGYAWGG